MAEKFVYDPEGEDSEGKARTRLPFGLCKAHGIQIQDWWTPKDAWDALRNRGIVKDVSEEYKNYYKELKKKKAKAAREKKKERQKQIAEQEAQTEHMPEQNYTHTPGAIAGAKKGSPMTFEQADSGNVNPYYNKGFIGYATNCQTCVAVYVARRQGYDVRALPNLNNREIKELSHFTNLAYVDENGRHPEMVSKPRGGVTDRWLSGQMQEGDRFAVRGTWKGRHCGHIIVAEKVNGAMQYYDPQTNTKYNAAEAQSKLFGSMKDIRAFNVTNARLDEKFCDKIMKGNRK